ncbi:MAG: ABC transporter permease subunit [Candidatus Omnitrophota bacterium]
MNPQVLKRAKRRDRMARWLIGAGGIGVIGCVALMLVLIVSVALPLFRPARAEVTARLPLPGGVPAGELLALGLDEYLETGYALDRSGRLTFFSLPGGQFLDGVPLRPPRPGVGVKTVEVGADDQLTLLWENGTATLARVVFTPEFSAGGRVIRHRVVPMGSMTPAAGAPLAASLRPGEGDGVLGVFWLPGNRFLLQRDRPETLPDGTERTASQAAIIADDPLGMVSAYALDKAGATLYAGTGNGHLLRWDLSGETPRLLDRLTAFRDGRAITALGLVFGDLSLAIGDATGGLTTWMPVVSDPGLEPRLALIHTLARHPGPVVRIEAAAHNKCLWSLDAAGTVHLDYLTSERNLLALRGKLPFRIYRANARGTGALSLDAAGQLQLWRIANPHPEVSWTVLFGKVHYENYNQPAEVWQSSSASDDFEPKLSFIPLMFGSLKATLFALAFAVPAALLGAIYTSQFATPEVRGVVKPAVEIMAAVPSVVIGFLIALWLAPRVEAGLVAVGLFAVILPPVLILFMAAWQGVRRCQWGKRLERGREFLILIPVLLVTAWAAWGAGPWVEQLCFGGDARQWLYRVLGMRYDQRNSLIIAFGLGFAVIPILFTIAEDALSNVPKNLQAASLALGASRWQTVWRVILPSASPGVFAAVIIGFGRAVGETMIVLMATGNTPILDWSPFNGMRTLSANIAVEIPEAPAGGTLYRVLFLSAVLLFLLTSVLNTTAELVRHRLRKKYGQF